MDIPRPSVAKAKRRRRILMGIGVVGLLVLATVGLARLKPAAPVVDRSQVWTNSVQRGEMLRQVRGNGTLVPEEIVWIPTLNPGRVQRILVLPGAAVKADTVLVELTNPDVDQAAFDAEWQLKAAEAELSNIQGLIEAEHLARQAAVASSEAAQQAAQLDFEVNDALARSGLVPQLVLRQSKAKADELGKLLAIERERLRIDLEAAATRRAVQEARVAQYKAQLDLRRQHSEALRIRAGFDGVLQRLGDTTTLKVGQQLFAGANVARVANPTRLKAEIKIYETQAKDLQLGLKTAVDTRNGIANGRVARIDPAVENGTVTVDIAIEGDLPHGARPDLSVEGTIEIERLADVLYVGKPVGGNPDSTLGMFRLDPGSSEARRVQVRFGRSSVNTIEVLDGLNVGDTVILSDMSAWDAHDRIRLR